MNPFLSPFPFLATIPQTAKHRRTQFHPDYSPRPTKASVAVFPHVPQVRGAEHARVVQQGIVGGEPIERLFAVLEQSWPRRWKALSQARSFTQLPCRHGSLD